MKEKVKSSALGLTSRIFLYADIVLIIQMVASILCVCIPRINQPRLDLAMLLAIIAVIFVGPVSAITAFLTGLCSARERGDRTLKRILIWSLVSCVACAILMTAGVWLDPISLDDAGMSVREFIDSGDAMVYMFCFDCFMSYVYAGVAALLTAYRSYSFEPERINQNGETQPLDNERV